MKDPMRLKKAGVFAGLLPFGVSTVPGIIAAHVHLIRGA